MDNINAENNAELESVLKSIDVSVPPRTGGRTTEDCERWSICHLLSTLNREDELDFPLYVTKRERPDFEITLGDQKWGVEITEAVPTDYARAVALADSENPDAVIDMSLFKFGERKSLNELREIISQAKLTGDGWEGDSAEYELAEATRSVTDIKTAKLIKPEFEKYPRNILSVYDNMPLPHLNLDSVAGYLVQSLSGYWTDETTFNVIFIESGNTLFESSPEGVRKLPINDLWSKT